MPTSPRDLAGRHAAPRASTGTPTLGGLPLADDVEVIDGEVVDDEPGPDRPGRHRDRDRAEPGKRLVDQTTVIDVDVIDTPGGRPQPGTPLVTTGIALSRWVKWLRAKGNETTPVSPAAPLVTAAAAPSAAVGAAPSPPMVTPPQVKAPAEARADATTALDARSGKTLSHGGAADVVSNKKDDGPVAGDGGTPPPVSPHTLKGNPEPRGGFRSYLRPGFLVIGALLIQMAFIGAYVGAWHAPVAHGLPVAIVTSSSVEQFQAQVDRKTDAVHVETFTSRSDAFDALRDQDVYAVLVAGGGNQLELHLASAGGGAAAESLAQNYGTVSTLTGTPLEVYDDVPLPPSDNRGITPFYLVVGWVVGGYLVSTLLSFIAGATPEPRRGRVRILSLLGYSIASGIGGAVIVGPVLNIWHDNLVPLATLGVLVVFGASAAAAALSALFKSIGTGLTILLLVVLGNPGSGGPFAPEMLPGAFRGLHTWLLTGAATTATRSIVYFNGRGDLGAYLVLLMWCAAGSGLYLGAITLRGLRPSHVFHYLAKLPKH